ncbi:site-specific integrase [Spirosoma endbachense]|uniref:Tyrosine-type recombinase/integrase n=1 Tax=Spirosoma endbachense TaxID=2666025 RepID=A0A6P1VZS2_9BACT|nr:site-specific integrase [Spirosoma endbachense]QHV98285.1 tyrosine-type recombinase/integrase [Spirosoma endbachense]
MTHKVRYRLLFNRRKQTTKDGKAPVVIEAYQNGLRRYFATGFKVRKEDWDFRKDELKNPTHMSKVRKQITDLSDFETLFESQYKQAFTLKDFDLMLKAANQPNKAKATFSSHYREQLQRRKPELSYRAFQHSQLVLTRLHEFNAGNDLEFDTLTLDFIERFDFHLKTTLRLGANYIYKYHQAIKKCLDNAERKGLFLPQQNPYNDFRPKKARVNKVALQIEEIERIERLIFTEENQHLTFYRDAFLFAFYTSLRISDITRISRKHILQTNEGILLEFVTQKSKKEARLPLGLLFPTADGHSKPERILITYSRTDSQPFFRRSHVKMNKHLKEVIRMAGITKAVTFHTARHSGLTYLSTVLPTPMVKELAQHSDIQTTMGYVHTSGHAIETALRAIKWPNSYQK